MCHWLLFEVSQTKGRKEEDIYEVSIAKRVKEEQEIEEQKNYNMNSNNNIYQKRVSEEEENASRAPPKLFCEHRKKYVYIKMRTN